MIFCGFFQFPSQPTIELQNKVAETLFTRQIEW